MVDAQTRTYIVKPSDSTQRVDQCLAAAYPEFTRSRIKSLFAQGKVSVDGLQAKASRRVREREAIVFSVPIAPPLDVIAQDLPLTVVYEDDALMVVNKAAGMVTHPGAGNWDNTLVNGLLFRFQGMGGVGSAERPGLVHRLDKDTSGCMVIAKTDDSLHFLQAQFKARRVRKTYRALVLGSPLAFERIETLYGRHPVHRKRFTGRVKEGRGAITEYRVRASFEDAAELEVDLMTGRTHQIRVHLAERGFPLLADAVYGAVGDRKLSARVATIAEGLGRQALHAWRLEFLHPKTGLQVAFEVEPPADYLDALGRLKSFSP